MEEKQNKQIEIIRKVLNEQDSARNALNDAHLCLRKCALALTQDLSVIDVLSGHSELVMTASAVLGIAQQIEMVLHEVEK